MSLPNQQAIVDLVRASGLRNKILFTLAMLLLYRVGVHIPMGGIDQQVIQINLQGLLGFVDLFAGGALAKFSIFAMGIIPYINASIIMQLMSSAIPKLEEMRKEGGETGRRQIAQITRYLTIVLAVVQSSGMAVWLYRSGAVIGHPLDPTTKTPVGGMPLLWIIASVSVMVAGTILIMWMGELITEHGIGNGASLLIFTGIVSRLPSYIRDTQQAMAAGVHWLSVLFLVLVLFAMLVAIIYATEGQRRIPVQSAKRQVGRKVYGGRSSYIPFRINQGGVMPIIFASSVLMFPMTINSYAQNEWLKRVTDFLTPQNPFYVVIYFGLIVFFTFFYASLVLNPQELAQNLKRYGSFIPGFRPGRPTSEFIERVLARITFCGALFLGLIAIIPMIVEQATNVRTLQGLGSTALLIMVGVAIDLYNQLQAHLLARQYEGFIK